MTTTSANPRYLSQGDTPYFNNQDTSTADPAAEIFDKEWVRQAFLISTSDLGDPSDVVNRTWTSAHVKFTDTRLGGNIGINPRPQFTQYSDIPIPGAVANRSAVTIQDVKGNYGMGRYYSEAIDDNSQTIYLRFGVPQFSSLTSFLTNSFDKDQTSMARTGRGPSVWYSAGKVLGRVGIFVVAPATSFMMLAGRMLSQFFSKPRSKFYTMKPTMFAYWSAVNDLTNAIAVNLGIFPTVFGESVFTDANKKQDVNSSYKVDETYLSKMHDLMPDIFTDHYGYDIFAVANRAQRMANRAEIDMETRTNSGSGESYIGVANRAYDEKKSEFEPMEVVHSLQEFLKNHLKLSYYLSGEDTTKLEADPTVDPSGVSATTDGGAESWAAAKYREFASFFDAEFRQGAQFAAFRVDNTGTAAESFSNSEVESDLSSKFNSTSSQAREVRFTFAGGNIGDNPVANTIEAAVDAAVNVASGVIDGVTFGMLSNLQGLSGAGFIDIPKHWQSSNAELPSAKYTIQLVSPYGNPLSRMQNIFIPLAMILAGALPLSTGKQSYTSPFLVQLFDRGRCQIQLGMIDSLSITRGTGNLGFTNRGAVLAIDVSFSIKDYSSILHMPLSSGPAIDGDSILYDYLAVLAGQDMYSQIYTAPRAKLDLAKRYLNLQKFISPAYRAAMFHEATTAGMLRYIIPGKAFEAILPGSSTITR